MNQAIKPEIVLNEAIKNLGLTLEEQKKGLLLEYCSLLLAGLKKQRLTGENSIEDLINRQIYDCLFPVKSRSFETNSRIIDLGSGGGLPGIPLAICLPECKLFLLDASQKKAAFLEETVHSLELKNVNIIRERAENCGRDSAYREKFDYVLSKAVAKAAVLAELALPLLFPGGKAVFYKGPRGEQEMKAAARALTLCGGKLTERLDYTLPTGEKRVIYMVEKVVLTPAQYPRTEGKPARRPIK